ncbi:MMPL family transporter [bacterium]|nr:MMPL family transporter [bacterium]
MIQDFYTRHSKAIIIAMFVSLAVLTPLAESIPPNNDTETWLSDESVARQVYEDFRFHFGGEEVVLIALERERHSDEFIEALCRRLELLKTTRAVWSPQRLSLMMQDFGVDADVADARLKRIALSEDGKLAGIAVLLTADGLRDRASVIEHINGVLSYCQLDASELKMTGAPVIIAELNRLGGKEANQAYFVITMLICSGVLWLTFGELKTAGLILAETVWAFQFTLAVVYFCGGEMNFILDSLPVMVMVFTMAIAIHYLYHFTAYTDKPNAIGATLREVLWPCFLAMLTTAIGLASLGISDIGPVRQFGIATAGGTVAAFLAGLGITPAILTVCPPVKFERSCWQRRFLWLAETLYLRRKLVTASVIGIVAVCGLGVSWIRAEFAPLKFFPETSQVLQDTRFLQERMANTDSVEVVIDFGTEPIPDATKVDIVRSLEEDLRAVERVPDVLSAATFLPDPLPQGLDPALQKIQRYAADSDFIGDGGHLWRVSARVLPDEDESKQQIFEAISQQMNVRSAQLGYPIICTGIAPLIERAQHDIFDGFWKSVFTAFLLITAVMMVCLRSPLAAGVAMVPNVTPILLVFGSLGWMGIATDIGTMMTGSIALGIAVDGTFHFLTRYREVFEQTGDSRSATRDALITTGPPIVQATLITGLGMLALGMSNFGPTYRFGILMAVSLAVALVGDLILLPCLLYLRPNRSTLQGTTDGHVDETEGGTVAADHQVATPHADFGQRAGTLEPSVLRFRRTG